MKRLIATSTIAISLFLSATISASTRLDDGDLMRLIPGATFYLQAPLSKDFAYEFHADGTASLHTYDGMFTDAGTWRIDGNRLCATWVRHRDGAESCGTWSHVEGNYFTAVGEDGNRATFELYLN